MSQQDEEALDADEGVSFGERAVGLTFNPSGDPNVEAVKKVFAEAIDIIHELRESVKGDADKLRMYSIAITEAQSAQMWAVKAITWKSY